MKRMLMLAALAAFGLVGCKGTDHEHHAKNDMPMIGANGKKADGQVVQTAYRPGNTQAVQQAGGMTAPGTVVQAGGGTAACPNGQCPNGTCPNTQLPMAPLNVPVR